jgi:hypothetical protein
VQAVGPLLEAQFGIVAQQNDSSHPLTAGHLRERANHSFPVGGPGEAHDVEHIALRRETKILGGVVCCVCVVKRSSRHFGRTHAVNPPRTSAVDSFSVHIQPASDGKKHLLHFSGIVPSERAPKFNNKLPFLLTVSMS